MCVAKVTRFLPFPAGSGAFRAAKANENNFHQETEVGLFVASFSRVESESATAGRAALGIRDMIFVLARSLDRPRAIPQSGTSDDSDGSSGAAAGRPRHCRQCHTERALA